MDQGSLVREQIGAGNRFLRELDKCRRILVAFWFKNEESGRWTLYIATDEVNENEYHAAYEDIIRIAGELKDADFDPFQVQLLRPHDPMLKAALAAYISQTGRPPKIPFVMAGETFRGFGAEAVYFVQGPTRRTRRNFMPTGRETLDQIIDKEAEFFQQHGESPHKMKLPVLMAYDLAKCGRDELGEIAGRVFKDGITTFEKEGFHGMRVEIVRERGAALQLE